MAEGILRHLAHDAVEVESAGLEPSPVNPLAAKAVERLLNVDISGRRPKSVHELTNQRFDYVITLSDSAKAHCPAFFGVARMHWRFDDPEAVEGSEEARYLAFRQVAAELERRLQQLLVIIDRGAKESGSTAARDGVSGRQSKS